MTLFDTLVLIGTLAFIVIYGMIKSKGQNSIHAYMLGDDNTPWWAIGISVMATQASAITFMSTPGQAFFDGMGFVQFYFGLPISVIIICLVFLPIYHKLKVYTAYEYLETRFDNKTRMLTALLFIVQRGLAAGITIYAPAIILSTILGWNLNLLNFIIGVLVILYTVSGGSKAVGITQKQQMFVIFFGMFVAFFVILEALPDSVGLSKAMEIASIGDKLEILNFDIDFDNRYTFWSGITGGLFLSLSYFGTDQSQVQRYLSSKSLKESQWGLLFNGALKIPMQFFILLTGVMVFVFYQFNQAPIFFNQSVVEKLESTQAFDEAQILQKSYDSLYLLKAAKINEIAQINYEATSQERQEVKQLFVKEKNIRENYKKLIHKHLPDEENNDKDYMFIGFILTYLPHGLIGLLLAVIFSAAMSSTSSELSALSTTFTMDIYKRNLVPQGSETHYINVAKYMTVAFGILAIIFACIGSLFENLIQFVNIIGSLFYGNILGIFLAGFFLPLIRGKHIFWSAIITQCIIFIIFKLNIVAFLWLNLIGCILVIAISLMASVLWTSVRHDDAL